MKNYSATIHIKFQKSKYISVIIDISYLHSFEIWSTTNRCKYIIVNLKIPRETKLLFLALLKTDLYSRFVQAFGYLQVVQGIKSLFTRSIFEL